MKVGGNAREAIAPAERLPKKHETRKTEMHPKPAQQGSSLRNRR